jgi:LmbE family N-acetylglucosaminyl deacetylase
MIRLSLNNVPQDRFDILCLGCHSDDIEIGCGGTLLQLAQDYPGCVFHWVVFNAVGVRQAEARRGAELFGGTRLAGQPRLESFRDGFMPFMGSQIKEVFEDIASKVSPQLIFTHSRSDSHQDHRLIAELTWNTFRNHFVLEYEIPKYDGDMGQPSVFLPLSHGVHEQKARNIVEAFASQRGKRWFDETTFLSLMRLRGMECNSATGYAEAFYCRKLTL